MSRNTINDLYGQRATLSSALAQENAEKSNLNGKLGRLKKASKSLHSNVSEIEVSHNRIGNLTIDEGRWRGMEKNKFEQEHQRLGDSTKEYMSKAIDARNQVDEEVNRCEANLLSVESNISRYQGMLANVNYQIAVRGNS